MLKSYFVEYFLCRRNLRGFCYFEYVSCNNYDIITVLENYHILLKQVKSPLAVQVL